MNPWFLAICFVGSGVVMLGAGAMQERLHPPYGSWPRKVLDAVSGVAAIVVLFAGCFLVLELSSYADRSPELQTFWYENAR